MPSTVTGVNTSILTFNNLHLEVAGQYQCVATCEFTTGSDISKHAMLTFKGKLIYHSVVLVLILRNSYE